jgi:hypothetical protein
VAPGARALSPDLAARYGPVAAARAPSGSLAADPGLVMNPMAASETSRRRMVAAASAAAPAAPAASAGARRELLPGEVEARGDAANLLRSYVATPMRAKIASPRR